MLLVSTHEACHTVAPLLKMLQLYNNKLLTDQMQIKKLIDMITDNPIPSPCNETSSLNSLADPEGRHFAAKIVD